MQNSGNAQRNDLQELLLEDGEEFVQAAFMALLNRRPDATGGRLYLRALRNGTSKLQILHELSISEECRLVAGGIEGLADACVREGIGVPVGTLVTAPSTKALQIGCVEQIILLEKTDEFIDAAYWILLKRAPDAEGIANCHERIRGGVSKLQILNEIFNSPECREIGVELPGLRDAFIREGLEITPLDVPVPAANSMPAANSAQAAVTLVELLDYQGGQFVERAYLTLLKRVPDSQGFQHRLQQLLGGSAKIQILHEISTSTEALEVRALLPGLTTALRQYRASQTPILGRFVGLFRDVEGNSKAERRGRATEQRLLTLAVEIGERFEQLVSNIQVLSEEKGNAIITRQNDGARIASLERSVVALRQVIERVTHQVNISGQSSTVDVITQSSDRLALTLRAEEIARDLKQAR